MRIVAIHAHPDDIEFQCAGTLALLAERGHQISIATMTPGDGGSDELSSDEIAEVRRGEGAAAAALIGADYSCLEFRDLSIVFDNQSRQRVTEFVRKKSPDVVVTAPPIDYMADHEVTSRLVRDACFNASVPNYKTKQWDPAPSLQRVPHLYYVDPIAGVDYFGNPIEPGFVVDISTTFETRQEMLACHASQREWLRRQHDIDEYMDAGARWAEKRGQEIGVPYGEAFRQHLGHPHPQDNLLTSLLESES
ncbi:MAG: PIG-L deacetylase family protein [Planctomycetaceae bacterium]